MLGRGPKLALDAVKINLAARFVIEADRCQ